MFPGELIYLLVVIVVRDKVRANYYFLCVWARLRWLVLLPIFHRFPGTLNELLASCLSCETKRGWAIHTCVSVLHCELVLLSHLPGVRS